MKASEIDIRKSLNFQPENGLLSVGDDRMLLFRQEALATLRKLIFEQLGPKLANVLLTQFGYRCGEGDYKMLTTKYSWETDIDKLAAGPALHTWEGIVKAVPTLIECDRASGHFHMKGTWSNSYEAENHLAAFGKSDMPVCYTLTGYASGWATEYFGAPCIAIESKCQACGDASCEFEIRPAKMWGAEANIVKEALKPTSYSLSLKESEEKFRSLFESSHDAIMILEPPTWLFTNGNPSALSMFGVKDLKDLTHHSPWDFSPEKQPDGCASVDIAKEMIGKAMREGSSNFEWIHKRINGEEFAADVLLNRMEQSGQQFLQAIVRDITERKRSEALYQVLTESSMGAIFIVRDGKFRFINKNAIAQAGYTEDIQGRDADIMIHPEDRAMCSAFAREMLNGTRTTAYEFRIITKEHQIRWISQILTPIVYDGRPAILGNALDVTDLKESQTRLEEMKALESSIMSAIPHVVIGLQNDRILFANDAAETVFGWRPEDLIGCSLDIFCQDENECRKLVGQFRAESVNDTSIRQEAEIHCRRRDGRDIVCKATSCRTGGSAGDKIVAIFEDVTAKKMSQIQLFQAEKMASIGKLAAGVAHEINNPTAFVSSNLRTLSEYVADMINVSNKCRELTDELRMLKPGEPIPGKTRDRLQQLEELESRLKIGDIQEDAVALITESRDGTGRIARIVQDLKNFAHPGEEKQTSFNLNENIESTLNIVWNELKYKAVVHKDYGDIPNLRGYPQQLNQVFMNILVNAAQAIKERGEIRLSTRVDGGFIEIRISDTGIGIPPENLSKLFDPFFTTKEVGKGTGLGLHVAYSIIEKHNGNITVESTVGVGTTFIIRIPMHFNN